MRYPSDMMPTPCACCESTTDFRNLVSDPLDEYDMICTVCADDRQEAYDQEMENYYEGLNPRITGV